ncbi:MAG: type VI secretion system contractile sheath large subunit [Deltaproteobacteria bacterium]|nr:type VI secretion system contractile sheath large subunit [Deltaproteobacteria bacterium]
MTEKILPKILVVSDFGGADSSPQGIMDVYYENLNSVFDALQPVVVLNEYQRIHISGMADFSVENICQQLSLNPGDSDKITEVLHNARFQQVESAWRGLALLQNKLNADGVQLAVLHSSSSDVRQIFYDSVMLPQYEGKMEIPFTAALFDFDFTHIKDSLEVFEDLVKMGEAIKTPVLASTNASFFGIKNILHLSAMKDPLERLMSAPYHPFHRFRETETAFWGCLTVNRYLQRRPHTSDDYSEPCSASKPESYLWGRGVWILGANLIESYNTKGHLIGLAGLGTGGEQHGMPTRVLPVNRKESIETPLEAPISLDTQEALPYLGLSPIAQLPPELGGDRQPQMLYLHMAANLHRIPDPTQEKIGLLTVHTNLAYSVLIGRISNLATKLMKNADADSVEEMAKTVKQNLLANMWHKKESELSVVPDNTGILIEYKPYQVIHTRRFEITVHVPFSCC